jgi:hypothetical protein
MNDIIALVKEVERAAEERGEISGWQKGAAEARCHYYERVAREARAEERKRIVEMVRAHGKQNTYEGEERLVYDTTIQEILDFLTNPSE